MQKQQPKSLEELALEEKAKAALLEKQRLAKIEQEKKDREKHRQKLLDQIKEKENAIVIINKRLDKAIEQRETAKKAYEKFMAKEFIPAETK